MKVLVATVICALSIAEALCGFGEPWKLNSIKARYSLLPINSYFSLPKSTKESSISEYEKIDDSEANLGIPASLWCRPNDPRVCIILDNVGNNVGVQISFLDQDTKYVRGFNYSDVNTYVRTNFYGQPAYSLRVYYTNPEKLTEVGRAPSDEVIDGIFVTIKGELIEVPKLDPKTPQSGHFYRQACFPQMGQHYFYEMSKNSTDCTQHVPFFVTYHNGKIVSIGIANYGAGSKAEKGGRDWYESVPLLGAQLIMPNRPQCVDDLILENGLYSLHVYFVEHPYLISCLFQ